MRRDISCATPTEIQLAELPCRVQMQRTPKETSSHTHDPVNCDIWAVHPIYRLQGNS